MTFPWKIFKSAQSPLIKIVIIQGACSNQMNSFRACYLNNIIDISKWAINWCVQHEETTAQYRTCNNLSHCMSVSRNILPELWQYKMSPYGPSYHQINPQLKTLPTSLKKYCFIIFPSLLSVIVSQIIICSLYTQALFGVFPLFYFCKANIVGFSL